MSRDPDLITRKEAAELLGVSVSKLSKGWGPPPLPQYRRPRYYSREICKEWLEQHRRAIRWDYTSDAGAETSADVTTHGGRASRSRGKRSGNRLAQQVAARVRRKSAAYAQRGSGPTVVVLDGED